MSPTRNELHARRPRQATLRGVAFTVDSTPDWQAPGSDEAQTRLFTGFTAVVTCAGGRGRLDVGSTTRAPAWSANEVTIAAPLAGPGDYYLFDSTGAILVRPARRTYARLPFTYSHVGLAEDRTGWPSEWWEISPIRMRPLLTAAPADTV